MCNYLKLESIVLFCLVAFLAGCGGSGSGSGLPPEPQPPPTPTISVDVGVKQLIFNWPIRADVRWQASYYKLLENPDGHSGFTQVGDDIPAEMGSVRRDIAVHLFDFANALYILEACNNYLCSRSTEINVINGMLDAVGYFKASNTDGGDGLNARVALSADGMTLALAAGNEDSEATEVNGDQANNASPDSGAVYIYRNHDNNWSQQAYIKASNSDELDNFGEEVALSADGNTLAVGARREDSGATGINGDQADNSASASGAAYLFRFDGNAWYQQAYIKASNTDAGDQFGGSVALSADGNTLAVGAHLESTPIVSGATYLFRFDGNAWYQQAYIKASNVGFDDYFGWSVALGADGDTLAVGAFGEYSSATGIGGDQSDNSVMWAGATYLFRFDGNAWYQQAYIKASNTDGHDRFGWRLALSADGNTLAVGAPYEDSSATGINGDQADNSASRAGAAYLFRFDGNAWYQQAYVKASNASFAFGGSLALSADGDTLAVGGGGEDSSATGIDGDQADMSAPGAGAAYLFRFSGNAWQQQTYVKSSNTDPFDGFGGSVALSADGNTLAVGANGEDSSATGINGDQADNSAENAGAVYVY